MRSAHLPQTLRYRQSLRPLRAGLYPIFVSLQIETTNLFIGLLEKAMDCFLSSDSKLGRTWSVAAEEPVCIQLSVGDFGCMLRISKVVQPVEHSTVLETFCSQSDGVAASRVCLLSP